MADKKVLKKIVKRQIENRSRQYISLRLLTIVLCFFLTAASTILFNEMNVMNGGKDFNYIAIGVIGFLFLYFVSFYSVTYINFYRERINYSILLKCGFTKKEIQKSMKYFAKYLARKSLLLSGIIGIFVGLLITWKYKKMSSLILGVVLIGAIYLCIQIALKLCIKRLLKVVEIKPKYKKSIKGTSTQKLNVFMLAKKYLTYHLGRSVLMSLILLLSGVLLSFSFSMSKSINIDKYVNDNWGDPNYKITLYKEGDTSGSYHLLQIDNPLTEELRQSLLRINGIESITPLYSLETFFDGDTEVIESSLENVNEDILKKSKVGYLNSDEIIISINESLLDQVADTIKKKQIKCKILDGEREVIVKFNVADVITDNSKGIRLYATENTILEIANNSPLLLLNIHGKNGIDIDNNINDLIKGKDLLLESKTEYEKGARDGLQILEVGIFAILIIVILFAITIALNMKFMSTISRKNDFRLLGTIGMSRRSIQKMLIIEDWYCNIFIIILSDLLGNYLSYIVCKGMDKIGATFMVFQRTMGGIIWSTILFVVISIVGLKVYTLVEQDKDYLNNKN